MPTDARLSVAAWPYIGTVRPKPQSQFDEPRDVSFVSLPMQLTKQQKIVGAVLVLAVVAFGVDRWVIGTDDDLAVSAPAGPRHSGAARRAIARPAKPVALASTTAPEASLGSIASLATRLTLVAKAEELKLDGMRDAFRPPAAWVGTTRVVTPDEMAVAARDFQSRKLTAVIMRNSGRGVAIVDQRTVGVGQSLDGFVLVAVKERSAVFRRGGQRVELRLPEDAQPGVLNTSEKTAGIDPSR